MDKPMKVVANMYMKQQTKRDARRIARNEARTLAKKELMPEKQKVAISPKLKLILLVCVAIILAIGVIAAIVYDSRTYVATVDGKRISTKVYTFFLRQQQYSVENREGLTSKTEEERKA